MPPVPSPAASAWPPVTPGAGAVAVSFFGDGAVNEGMLMEALNLAAAWRLPVVFVCKDNRWAVSTRSDALTGGGLRRRLRAFGVPVVEVDGRDVERVDRAARRAVARGRAGAGPTLLLARCARLEGHFLGDPLVRLTSALGELVAQVRPLVGQLRTQPGAPVAHRVGALSAIGRRAATLALERPGRGRQDPLRRAARRLPPEVAATLAAKAREEVERAVQAALVEAGDQCLGRRSPRRSTGRWRSRWSRDPRVVVLGEDVRMLRRTAYVRFGGDRVLDSPISESALLGAALGSAMAGLRPVVEIMFVDFIGVALDQLLNHAAKVGAFTGGRWQAPLVVRAACGGGYGDAGQHEQALWGLLAGIPGLGVVVPSTPADAAGLLLAAIEDPGPVVFLEHKLLSEQWLDYLGGTTRDSVTFDVPAAGAHGDVADEPAPVPLGRAALRREGSDMAMISLGVGVHRCIEAAEQLSAERGVRGRPRPAQRRAPGPGCHRWPGRAHRAGAGRRRGLHPRRTVRGGRGAARGARRAPRHTRGSRREETIPYARTLEAAVLPNVARIVAAARRLMTGRPVADPDRAGRLAAHPCPPHP